MVDKSELYVTIELAVVQAMGAGASKTHAHLIETLYARIGDFLERNGEGKLAMKEAG